MDSQRMKEAEEAAERINAELQERAERMSASRSGWTCRKSIPDDSRKSMRIGSPQIDAGGFPQTDSD
jgi:hypothetical protein